MNYGRQTLLADPSNLSAKAISNSQINTSWTQNASSDNVMLAWSADGTFGTPTDGNAYVAGNTITGGGEVIYNGSLAAYNHTGLSAGTQYYYKAWSADASDNYSSGITANETTPVHTSIIISELSDPADVYQARFVEIYNLGASTIDFATDTWYLCRQTNGGATWEDKQLTGSVLAAGEYVAANGNADASDYFNVNYGFMADFDYGGSAGNGNDGYFLYFNGDHTTGTLIDAYGVADQDGSGTDWEYTDSKAVRLRSTTSPNTVWASSEWSIMPSANVDDMTPSAHNEDVSWVGNITDWNTKGTDCWDGTHNFIPDASFNVTIPSAVSFPPSTSATSECNNLIINASASATVSYNAPLTVFGNLDINLSNASLNIGSGASGNGSVIVKGSIGGPADVSRYFEAYTGAADGWHYISSPVSSMTIASSDFDPSGTNNDLYAWDEDDYLWRNYKGSYFPSSDFVNGTGYMVAYQANVTNHFIGSLNNSDIIYSNLSKTPAKGDGWHLLGNPFPSAIKWATSDWALTNVGGVAKVYNEAAGTYADINANGIIPSTNGFFVQASVDASNSITIPASARTHDNTNNYKYSPNSDYDETLKLLVNNDENTFYDITTIGFRDDALPSFDWAFDSHKMYGQLIAPQIWTLSEGEEYSTNFLPQVYENLDLPLNFKAGTNTTYHILAQGIENFYQNSEIYLEDLQTNNIIDLREQQIYTFEGKTSDINSRFILHFYGITHIDNSSLNDDIKVYGSENKILIKSPPNLNYTIIVYDIMGRKIYSNIFLSGGLNTININAKNGIYIVKLRQGSSINITKIRL
ncbi:MAG: T9SS type A sorting domain-containing protein [Chlorobi bacterium]|nr:T9SS type A sorting domain-containing protein [Chlorobiota bacterium]